ncbi:MAG TPA: pyridoxamine 5'-phosphate oxidase [Acidobacteriota bacterium]|nr:pyridoxamine 5'-phosphate oxidase [Acidobacteriota bacterium]
MDISDIRREYSKHGLTREEAGEAPFDLFAVWFAQARESEGEECNAMGLATADAQGRPSLRVVLLKGCDERGFVFFTNYQSRKGREIEENPQVALTFHWSTLERQVRIEGVAQKVSQAESDAYFNSRPRLSRLAAAVSPQSRQVEGRHTLEKQLEELAQRYQDQEIPRPPHWGGYLVRPHRIEFWQGRPGRLHDRIVFERRQRGWTSRRLAP